MLSSVVSFDPIYGSSLLTTAQNSELRVYDPHNWSKPALLLKHPHRHFQHMTNIRASWHPFYEDLCIIGRYAETNDTDKTRYVDVVDVRKGEVVGQLYDPAADKITVVRLIVLCIVLVLILCFYRLANSIKMVTFLQLEWVSKAHFQVNCCIQTLYTTVNCNKTLTC